MRYYKRTVFGLAAVLYPFGRDFIAPPYKEIKDVDDKTYIVTGATGHLGVSLAWQIALRQGRVIMACRDMDKCKIVRRELVVKTNNRNIVCRHLDLEDVNSINKFADDIIETEPQVNVLINNAAVKHVDSKQITKLGYEKNYTVNYLGPFLLTIRLLDKLKESSRTTKDSRIVNVIGRPKASWPDIDLADINFVRNDYDPKVAYRRSKLALAYFTYLLDKQLRNDKTSHVYVYGSDPMGKKFTNNLDLQIDLDDHLRNLLDFWRKWNPENGTSTTVRCALSEKYIGEKHSGKLYTWFCSHWGWFKISDEEVFARAVWNHTARALLRVEDA